MRTQAWTFAALAVLVACGGSGERATTGVPLPPIGAAGNAAGSGGSIVVSLPVANANSTPAASPAPAGAASVAPTAAPTATPSASSAPSIAPSILPSTAPGTGPAFGVPALPSGVTGNCSAGIAFTGINQVATLPVSDPGYFGGFTVASTAPAVAYATLSAGGAAITTLAAGSATITVTDAGNLTASCGVTVTLTSTMLQ